MPSTFCSAPRTAPGTTFLVPHPHPLPPSVGERAPPHSACQVCPVETRPSACVLGPGHTRQEEAALRPEWGQRRPCLKGESHLLSCERPCASSLGFGFLVKSSSPLADLKLRGEEEIEAGLGHLEGNAEAETKCRTESLRPSCFLGLRNQALRCQRRVEEPIRAAETWVPILSTANQLSDLGQTC